MAVDATQPRHVGIVVAQRNVDRPNMFLVEKVLGCNRLCGNMAAENLTVSLRVSDIAMVTHQIITGTSAEYLGKVPT